MSSERSDSSASTTIHSPLPQPAFEPGGAQLAADDIGRVEPRALERVHRHRRVVVLPWVPVTARQRRSAAISASRSARCSSRSAAGALGVPGRDRGRVDDLGAGGDVAGGVAEDRLDPVLAQPLGVARLGSVRAGHRGAELVGDQRQTAHPGAADADEVQPAPVPVLCRRSQATRLSGRRLRRRATMRRRELGARSSLGPQASLVACCVGGRVGGRGGAAGPRSAPRRSARPGAAKRRAPIPYSATRDPANPLALATAPGREPADRRPLLRRRARARRRRRRDRPAARAQSGVAARHRVVGHVRERASPRGSLHGKLAGNPGLAHQVAELSKIADPARGPARQRLLYGGRRGGIFAQTQKLLCHNLRADPGSILILNTYFLHPAAGVCPGAGALPPRRADLPAPRQRGGRRGGAPPGRDAARDRRDRHQQLHPSPRRARRVGSAAALRDRQDGGAPARRRLRRGRLRGLRQRPLQRESPQRDRRPPDPRLLHQRHAHQLDDQRGPLGDQGLEDDPRRPLHRQHRPERQRSAAQPPSRASQGIENLCNPPGRGAGAATDHQHRVRAGRRVAVDLPPGQQQRPLPRRPGRRLFWTARAIGLAEQREQSPGPEVPQPARTSPRGARRGRRSRPAPTGRSHRFLQRRAGTVDGTCMCSDTTPPSPTRQPPARALPSPDPHSGLRRRRHVPRDQRRRARPPGACRRRPAVP